MVGIETVPYKFVLHKDDGEEVAVFVKTMDENANLAIESPLLTGLQNLRGFLRHEASFYQQFLPEIGRFLKEKDQEQLANEVSETFPVFYGYEEKDNFSFLVLEDVTAKGFKFDPMEIGANFPISKIAVSKLGTLNGIFYAWQQQTSPPEDFFGTEEYKKDCKAFWSNLIQFGVSNGGLHRLVKLLKESPSGRFEKLPQDLPFEKMADHVAALEKLEEITTESDMMGPTLGDFHANNMAILGDKLKFFDFTHYRKVNLMAELNRYCGMAIGVVPHRNDLRDAYISSFIKATARLGENVSEERLMEEFNKTSIVYLTATLYVMGYLCFFYIQQNMTKPFITFAKVFEAIDQGSEEARDEIYKEIDIAGEDEYYHFWRNFSCLCYAFHNN